MLLNRNGEICPVRGLKKLSTVDCRLATVMIGAFRQYYDDHGNHDTTWNWRVTCGIRTKLEQKELVRAGKSWTMNSYHLRGQAVDLAAISPDWKTAVWDYKVYEAFDHYVVRAARAYGLLVTWGGVWKQRDAVHWQIEIPRQDFQNQD